MISSIKLMKIIRPYLKFAALALACLVGHRAQACSPIEAIGISFEKNSSVIPEKERLALQAWTGRMRHKYKIRDAIDSEPAAETTEWDAEQLGRNRELAVRLALIDDNFIVPIFRTTEKVTIERARAARDDGAIETRSVWLNFLPRCPHECACQD